MEHIMEQTLQALRQSKIMHFFSVRFYKSGRRNAKLLKTVNLFIDNVTILNLTDILDTYIMLYKNYKNLHITINISKHYMLGSTALKDIIINTYNNVKFSSYECFINAVVNSLILLNPNNINTLGDVHNSVIVRQYINKFYHS